MFYLGVISLAKVLPRSVGEPDVKWLRYRPAKVRREKSRVYENERTSENRSVNELGEAGGD